jgi:tRNA U34 5-carboxymethylaminomethyl modifying GTPase MnmE/TrmE
MAEVLQHFRFPISDCVEAQAETESRVGDRKSAIGNRQLEILNDTIVAVSTPAGPSVAAIVRLSGPEALSIPESLLAEPRAHLADLPHYSAVEAALRLRADGPRVPASLYLMRAPRSYTRQDVAEVHTIGSTALLRMLLDALVERGARVAAPGEFTRRAFLNGRIDLAQAEAVLALIQATSAGELRAAARALQGDASRLIRQLHDALIGLRAQVEASIDFAEHDIELIRRDELLAAIGDFLAAVGNELRNADAGALPPEGIRVALCGLPNAGKSSLFNALLGRDRAIVTEIPGTTRDAIAELLLIDGIRFRLYDTAGLAAGGSPIADCRLPISQLGNRKSEIGNGPPGTRHAPPTGSRPPDHVDIEAMSRSRGLIAGTHIALVVLDASRPAGDAERELWGEIRAPQKLLVLSKCDLPGAIRDEDALALLAPPSIRQPRPLSLREPCSPSLRQPCSLSLRGPHSLSLREPYSLSLREPYSLSLRERAGVRDLVEACGRESSSAARPGAPHPPPLPEGEGKERKPDGEGKGMDGKMVEEQGEGQGHELAAAAILRTSAVTGEGIAELKGALASAVRAGRVDASPSDLTWNARHREALRRARAALERARDAAADDLGAEFIAADLRDTHDALGAITGQIVPEDILDLIFAQFCIGK